MSRLLTGMAIGSGLMFLLDPDRGNRRRARLRDKVIRGIHVAQDAADKTVRDLRNRAQGTVAEVRSALRGEEVPDGVLVERVRARLGRAVSHPNSIEVRVDNGVVILSGPVLEHEVHRLLRSVQAVRGVRSLDNRLELHKEPGTVPGLQGGVGRTGIRPELLQDNWAPAIRLLAGTTGLLLLTSAPRGLFPLRVLGVGLLVRSASNRPLRRMLEQAREELQPEPGRSSLQEKIRSDRIA